MAAQLLFGLMVGVGATIAVAAPMTAQTPAGTIRFELDNDLFAIRGTGKPADYDYTAGTQVDLEFERAPSWMRRLACPTSRSRCDTFPDSSPNGSHSSAHDRVTAAFGLGQDIYTPRHDTLSPVPGERPYAGWLFASATARRISGIHSGERVRTLSATLGVIGPPSLAADVQNGIHRLLNNHPQLGWAHQLLTEPGVLLEYDDAHVSDHHPTDLLTRILGTDATARTSWHVSAAAGNVLTGLNAGATGWIGLKELRGQRSDYSLDVAPERDPPMRVYLVGGIRGDAVLHSIFIDGNTFVPSVRATRVPLVWQSELGVGVRTRRLSAEYRFITRGVEYAAEPGPHSYGAISVAVHEL